MKKSIEKFFQHKWWPLGLAMLIVGFFSFFKLGSNPLYEWDESLHGELALEMLCTGDLLNYYFGGEPEAWFAKPPLAIWAIALSFKALGANVWALRLPSALAMLGLFFYLFRLIKLYRNNYFAFFTVLMLVSINGLICIHVGRSGDTDALLVFFLVAASYHFLKFIDFGSRLSVIWAGCFLGLAFLTKGPASVVLLPGWFLYILFTRQLKSVLLKWQTWAGLTLYLAMAMAWIVAVSETGHEFDDTPYEGKNAVETTFKYDLISRFTEEKKGDMVEEFTFFFNTMDARFTLWCYWIYLLLLVAIFQRKVKEIFKKHGVSNLHVFALFCWLPLCLFLTIASGKQYWYMAPALPFIGINAWELIRYYSNRYAVAKYITAGFFMVTLVIKTNYFNTVLDNEEILANNEQNFEAAPKVIFTFRQPFNYFLFIHFRNPNTQVQADLTQYKPVPGDILALEPGEVDKLESLGITYDLLGENHRKTIVRVK